jgi:hypothetical protein
MESNFGVFLEFYEDFKENKEKKFRLARQIL